MKKRDAFWETWAYYNGVDEEKQVEEESWSKKMMNKVKTYLSSWFDTGKQSQIPESKSEPKYELAPK